MSASGRLAQLLLQGNITGIEFVSVDTQPEQVTLDVYFFEVQAAPSTILTNPDIQPEDVKIYRGEQDNIIEQIEVSQLSWTTVDSREVLRLTVGKPGTFASYKLHLSHDKLDPYFNDVSFSFQAACPQDIDCQTPAHRCPAQEREDFPVDYLARDFTSYRRALLEFASHRYPQWQDREEADVGMMMVEVMSALGDELAYYQDRIAREAYLETAAQRRSLRQLARLVDYEIHNGQGATGWIDIEVKSGQNGDIPAGTVVWSQSERGTRICFSVGRNLQEEVDEKKVPPLHPPKNTVNVSWNSFAPYIWDTDEACLPVGSTQLYLQGDQTLELTAGKTVLLQTTPATPGIPARRWLVQLDKVAPETDPLTGQSTTCIRWGEEQALPFELSLLDLEVRGNLLPVSAGQTVTQYFVVGAEPSELAIPEEAQQQLTRTIERTGPEGAVIYRFTLPDEQAEDLVWLCNEANERQPEITLTEVTYNGGSWVTSGSEWQWRRSLLGVSSSLPQDRHYTLEDGRWDRVVGYWRNGQEIVHQDYAGNTGTTIRFGDGVFGLIPKEQTVFQVQYRLGNGVHTNVAADTLLHRELNPSLDTLVESITNPLPTVGGLTPETPAKVRQLAPEAFRAKTYRAVKVEDYADALKQLDWVQQAGATQRWTGSWLTVFATPDPHNTTDLQEDDISDAQEQLDRFRQAGREVCIRLPQYASLDLKIHICVEPSFPRDQVREEVLYALLGKPQQSSHTGFFSPNNFTFGTPLQRSQLESVIQRVPGVKAVQSITIRRRGWFDWHDWHDWTLKVGNNELIRVENNPNQPKHGSINLYMQGGAD